MTWGTDDDPVHPIHTYAETGCDMKQHRVCDGRVGDGEILSEMERQGDLIGDSRREADR